MRARGDEVVVLLLLLQSLEELASDRRSNQRLSRCLRHWTRESIDEPVCALYDATTAMWLHRQEPRAHARSASLLSHLLLFSAIASSFLFKDRETRLDSCVTLSSVFARGGGGGGGLPAIPGPSQPNSLRPLAGSLKYANTREREREGRIGHVVVVVVVAAAACSFL